MTEALGYRLNQVPEKNCMRFLDMLGMRLQPASSARAPLTFRLSVPFPITPGDATVAVVPQGTEVATRSGAEDEPEIIFTTDNRLAVVPPVLTQIRRTVDFNKNYLPRLGVELFLPFQQPPNWAIPSISALTRRRPERPYPQAKLRVRGDPGRRRPSQRPASGLGVASAGDGAWTEVAPQLPGRRKGHHRRTEQRATRRMVFYLPLGAKADQVQGRVAVWLRSPARGRGAKSRACTRHSPEGARDVKAFGAGRHHHGHARGGGAGTSTWVRATVIPASRLRCGTRRCWRRARARPWRLRSPRGRPGAGALGPGRWSPARRTALTATFPWIWSTGEVAFGPAIRQRDGTVHQYGRVPEAGRQISFPIPSRRRSRRQRARGTGPGHADGHPLHRPGDQSEPCRRRQGFGEPGGGQAARPARAAGAEGRTADDYEGLAKGASRAIARVKCATPGKGAPGAAPGVVELLGGARCLSTRFAWATCPSSSWSRIWPGPSRCTSKSSGSSPPRCASASRATSGSGEC